MGKDIDMCVWGQTEEEMDVGEGMQSGVMAHNSLLSASTLR